MKKINLSITGCMGRMGQEIIKSVSKNKLFKIVSLTENRKINRKILLHFCTCSRWYPLQWKKNFWTLINSFSRWRNNQRVKKNRGSYYSYNLSKSRKAIKI